MKKSLLSLAVLLSVLGTGKDSYAQLALSSVVPQPNLPGATCGYVSTNVSITGCTSICNFDVYFGDGDSTNYSLTCPSSSSISAFGHFYATSGVYSIRVVIRDGTGPTDSTIVGVHVNNCRELSVLTYFDTNSNCMFDATDIPVYAESRLEVDSAGIAIDTVSAPHQLRYGVYGPPGTMYSFRVLTPPAGAFLACSSSGICHSFVPALGVSDTAKYIGYACSATSTNDLSVSATFRPALAGGAANTALVNVYNTSCSGTATPAILNFEFGPKYAFHSIQYSASGSYTVSGTSVSIDMGMVTVLSPQSVRIRLQPTTSIAIGDTIHTKFTVTPFAGDPNISNNVLIRIDTVRGSCDPNQKSVSPSGPIAPGTRLEYMLEFENTGNDTAYNVHIMDTLSDYLDINSLHIVGSTHPLRLMKYVNAGNSILKFDFPDIRLADSSDHVYCKGSVTFAINAKETLGLGTVIPNRAGIYFDANDVVMTNTAFSMIPFPAAVREIASLSVVEIYPNPVNDVLNIHVQKGTFNTVNVYNVTGQMVAYTELDGALTSIDMQHLIPGIYYASLKGAASVRTIKFVKR